MNGNVSLLAAALSVLSLGGCAEVGDRPELGQVTGTITMDGEPLEGIAVVFYPDGGRPARDTTDAEGKYDLIYIRETRGTKLGHNRVEIAPDEEVDEEEEEAVANADSEDRPSKPQPEPARPKIPARYNRKSELEADVQPGGNVLDFSLESASPT